MRRPNSIRFFLVVLTLLLLGAPPSYALASNSPVTHPSEATVTVDGRAIKAIKGRVIAGTKGPQGECSLSHVKALGRISFTVNNETCQLTIDDVQDSSTATETAQTLSLLGTYRTGWAQTKYQEQVHIDVAKTYVEMSYYDDYSEVYWGYNPSAGCWWQSWTGWYNLSCGPWYWHSDGPNEVYIESTGEFDNDVGPYIWLWTKFRGFPSGGYWPQCDWYVVTNPPFWHGHCDGGVS